MFWQESPAMTAIFYLTYLAESAILGAVKGASGGCTTRRAPMVQFDLQQPALVGQAGQIVVPQEDEVTRKLAMLIEGECEGLGPIAAARKFSFSKQRYFQLRDVFGREGATALLSKKRGPQTQYRRTEELIRQVIRHRFLDPAASAEVIAQRLRQSGFPISTRSVERVIEEYGLQKKTP